MYLLYNIIIFFFILIYLPVLLYQKFKGKYSEGVKEKFSFIPKNIINNIKDEDVFWVQAASVGEVMAAKPLIKKIKNNYPDKKVLLSTMTDTGRETAKKIDGVSVIYFPLDFIFIVKRALQLISPELIILIETEIWPNVIKEAKKINSKVIVVSGRISDKSMKNYKYIHPLLKKTLLKVDYFSMQTELDKKRILELGAPQSLVSVEGNIKFDREFSNNLISDKEIRNEFNISKEKVVFVAGSTHNNEEEKLISVYKKLKEKYNDLIFLIAPRYIDRAENIKKLYNKKGFKAKLRTNITNEKYEEEIVIVNTLGELVKLYKIADIVFVGGSLIKKGGHNILEPAAQEAAIFFGPYMFNFKKDTKYFLENKAAIQVEDKKELKDKILEILNNREKKERLSKKAKELVEKNRGACENNLNIISNILSKKRKILLVRLSAIGDVIHTLPIAKVIRQKYKKAQIDWIVENKAKALVEMNPFLDNVYELPKSKWKKDFKENKLKALKEAKEFFKEFKKNDYDLVLDVHGLFKSGITSYFSGANKRFGPSDNREGSKIFYTDILDLPDKKIHQVDRNLELAKDFTKNIVDSEIDYGLDIPEAIENKIQEKANKWGLDLNNFIVINPFTTWKSKDWIKERYISLVNNLILKYDYQIAFTGGPKERDRIKEIIEGIKRDNRVFNLAAKTDLKELTFLYKKAKLFIGGDTGPLHLAAALELPIVTIMGPTDPKTHGPYSKNSTVLQADLECINCWDRKCKRDKHYCMEKVEVMDVLKSVDKVMKADQVIRNE